MASSSNQIQADIAQTRARIDQNLDTIQANPQASVQSLTAGVTNLIRRRPLTTLGFSLFAGALLQDLLGGAQGAAAPVPSSTSTPVYPSTSGAPSYGTSALDTAGATAQRVGQRTQHAAANVADTASNAVSTVADTAASAASTAVDTATNAASTAADAASNVASTVVDTAASAASTVADIASEVSTTVADTTVSAANRVGETLSNTGEQVADTVSNLGTTLNRQIQERPLTVLGVAIGAGALLQPVLEPYVSGVTRRVQTTVDSVGQTVSDTTSDLAPSLALPNQDDAARIRQALVPATVERAQKLTNREFRDYLETRLEPVVGQASLRAGIVAAVTDKAGEVVETRLPSVLDRSLTGTRAVLVAALLGAVLDAYTKSQQGEGKTTEIVRRDLAETLTETSKEQLQRYFPEFREHYQQLQEQSA